MAKKRPIISLPRGTVQKFCQAENISTTALYNALNYSCNSAAAKRLRKIAVSVYGGIEWNKPIL